jgi:hypothetical protein
MLLNRPRGLLAAATIAMILIAVVGAGVAQEQQMSVEGRVQWISGQRMVVAPVGAVVAPAGTSAINVDLSQVAQGEYSGLAQGDAVVISGTVSSARDRIVATSIRRLTSGR